MKFTINSTVLNKAIKPILPIVPLKSTIEELTCFHISAKDNLEIFATDLETFIVSRPDANIEESGEVLIDARLLSKITDSVSDKELCFVGEGDKMEITWNGGKFTIPVSIEVNDFPTIQRQTDSLPIQIKAVDFVKYIDSTLFATGSDDLRPVMQGIYCDIENGYFAASNGYMLSRIGIGSIRGRSFIIPKKTAQIVAKLNPSGDVAMETSEKSVWFNLGSYDVGGVLINGKYPNYLSVIPKNEKIAEVNRVELLSAVKRVSVCADKGTSVIAFTISGDNIKLSAKDIDFSLSASENVVCKYNAEEMTIGFKVDIITAILSNLSSERVEILLSEPSKAAVIRPVSEEDILMLAMPMVVNK